MVGKGVGLNCISSSHAPGGSEHRESFGEMLEQHITKSEENRSLQNAVC